MVIRLTEAEREQVKELAGAENKSMNQYVLDKVLSNNDSKEADNDSASDMTINVLSQQIAVKDEQIKSMQQLLDQQQRITLAEVGEKDRLRIESNELKKKNLFQRLFRR